MTGDRGASLVEALVGLALGALAAGVLAASLAMGTRAFSLATGVGVQTIATLDGLEQLRLEPAGETTDVVGTTPAVTRRRTRTTGRGLPDALRVDTTWTSLVGPHPFVVASECGS
jgi:hypothetical protein